MSADDGEYLYALCESTMRGFVEATWGHWNENRVRTEFMRLAGSGNAWSVFLGAERVGAFILSQTLSVIVLEQIFIATEHQRRGIGSVILADLQRRARASGSRIRLSVFKVNPAKAFYEGLGFKVVSEDEVRYNLAWPGQAFPDSQIPNPARGP